MWANHVLPLRAALEGGHEASLGGVGGATVRARQALVELNGGGAERGALPRTRHYVLPALPHPSSSP